MNDELENDLWNYFVDEADQSNEWRTFLSGYEYSKKEIDSLKNKLDEAIKFIEIISKEEIEANPWTVVPSKSSLKAREFLQKIRG